MRKCSIFNCTFRCQLLVPLLAVLLSFGRMAAQCNPDVTPPVITCPPNVTMHTVFGDCSVVVALPLATVSDNCASSVTQSNDAPAGNDFPIGMNQVIFTATDAAGNASDCITKENQLFTGKIALN